MNEMRAPWPADETVDALLRSRARTHRDFPFLKCTGDWRTFGDIDRASERLAAGLAARGISKGDLVGVLSDNRDEVVELFFACAKLGAVQVPFNTFLKGDFLKYQVCDSSVTSIFVDSAGWDAIRAVVADSQIRLIVNFDSPIASNRPDAVPYADVLGTADVAPEVVVQPNELLGLIYTSGTTGMPKGCMLPHGYYRYVPYQYLEDGKVEPGDRLMCAYQLFHTAGQVYMLMTALAAPAQLIIKPSFRASRFMADARAEGADRVFGVGAMAMAILAQPKNPHDGEGHQLKSATWVPLDEESQLEFETRFAVPTWGTGYGQSECMPIVHADLDAPKNRRAAGRPVPSLEVRIFDDADNEAPIGSVGEIVTRPRYPNMMYQGYWRASEHTLTTMANLWHHTGDYGRMDEAGYLYFVDRKQQALRRRGENISSIELENAIRRHPAVKDVAIHGVPSELSEEDVRAVIVLEDASNITAQELFTFFAGSLPYFAIPRYVDIRGELPKNAVGRVMKHILKSEPASSSTWDFEQLGLTVARDDRRTPSQP